MSAHMEQSMHKVSAVRPGEQVFMGDSGINEKIYNEAFTEMELDRCHLTQ